LQFEGEAKSLDDFWEPFESDIEISSQEKGRLALILR
jgi:hypothetical protein